MKKAIGFLLLVLYASETAAYARAPSRLLSSKEAAQLERAAPASPLEELAKSFDKKLSEIRRQQALQEEFPKRRAAGNTDNGFRAMANSLPEVLPAHDIKVVTADKFYEITNGLTGVRIGRQEVFDPANKAKALAPIQAVQYADGTWSSNKPAYIQILNPFLEPTDASVLKDIKVAFLENTPEKTVVETTYLIDRPLFRHGSVTYPGGEAGEGYYKLTITVYKDSPVISIVVDGNYEVAFSFEISNGLNPDQARYRGYASDSAENGREPSGVQYRPAYTRPTMDAIIDLKYDSPNRDYPRHVMWYEAARWNTGRYWQMYDSKASESANLIGYFAGRASMIVGGGYNNGVSLYTSSKVGQSSASIKFLTSRRNDDNTFHPHIRYEVGLFISTKKDLKNPTEIQPIGIAMNRYGGLGDGRLDRYFSADYFNTNWNLFMPSDFLKTLIQRVKTDVNFYNYLYNAEPSARDLLDMWKTSSTAKRKEIVTAVIKAANELKTALTTGNGNDGIYDKKQNYWLAGSEFLSLGERIAVLLMDDQTSAADQEQLKAVAAGFGRILLDDDFVPFSNMDVSGLNMGTANMPAQYSAYRQFYVLLLADHPDFKDRVKDVVAEILKTLELNINESGAARSSTHYIQTMEPTLLIALQLKQRGIVDLFKTNERLREFAEFYLNLLAKEVRFGNKLKLIANGDGSTESSEIYGILAAGFRDVDADLSARLMGAWVAGGKRQFGFFGTTILAIDDKLPSKDPALADAEFDDYFSVLRNGWGTANETALWFMNGNYFRRTDHVHEPERGSFIAYALGSPLSVNWGSLYSPYYDSPAMHNTVFAASRIDWKGDLVRLDGDDINLNTNAKQTDYLSFENSASSTTSFDMNKNTQGVVAKTGWTRSVQSFRDNESLPIFYVQDQFTSKEPMIFSMNLMAKGAVETPSGSVTPPRRVWNGSPQTGPSLGPSVNLSAGVNRLGFTGQWGIDYDVIIVSDGAQEARIGDWAHTWAPTAEANEFQSATGRSFKEEQYTLRIQGTSGFKVLALPYKKGQRPVDRQVVLEGDRLIVSNGDEKTVIDLNGNFHSYEHAGTKEQSLATYGAVSAKLGQIEISGGAAEVAISSSSATIRIHGERGIRTIKLPDELKLDPASSIALSSSGAGIWTIDYKGGDPLILTATVPNKAPVLAAIDNKQVDEGGTVRFTVGATDAPNQKQTFSLEADAPEGAKIDPVTGEFTWTPTEEQGSVTNEEDARDYTITVRATDNGIPPMSCTKTFTVSVQELNSPAVIAAISNQTVKEGDKLRLEILATDTDLPVQTLTYAIKRRSELSVLSLPLSEYEEAEVDKETGVFQWTPRAGTAGSYSFTVLVSDGKTTTEQNFNVTVVKAEPAVAPRMSVRWDRKETQILIQGQPGKKYDVQASLNIASPTSWSSLGTVTIDASGQAVLYVDGDEHSYQFYRIVAAA